MAYAGGGRNPAWGRDVGPPPPTSRQAFSGYSFSHPHAYGGLPALNVPSYYTQPQQYTWGVGNYQPPHVVGQQAFAPGGLQSMAFASANRYPTTQPVINTSLPAANMTNSTGGVGCEPGYNYFFASEHTKIHVFRTGDTPPWNLPNSYTSPFHAVHVPVSTTLGDLLKGFGATNPEGSKNKVFEVHQGGNGKWYKGMCYKGDNEKDMEKTIKSIGWDETRTGLPGGKPVVYIYVTNG